MNLSDIVAVAVVIIFSMHHRISGILALLVVIACMQTYETKEGFGLPKMPSSSTPAVGSDDFFSWKTPDEFKQKYCIKGLSDSGWLYVLNSKIAPGPVDASGNPTYTDKSHSLYNNIDFATMREDPDCTRSTGGGGSTMGGIQGMCNPKCDWKMKQTKEGFTSTIEVSPVQNMKNVVKDNLRKAKTMTESFFSR
jgi:hypothetical protein